MPFQSTHGPEQYSKNHRFPISTFSLWFRWDTKISMARMTVVPWVFCRQSTASPWFLHWLWDCFWFSVQLRLSPESSVVLSDFPECDLSSVAWNSLCRAICKFWWLYSPRCWLGTASCCVIWRPERRNHLRSWSCQIYEEQSPSRV